MATWQISGEYMETCNCTYLCPCLPANLTAEPTEGDCQAALAMRIDKGAKDGVQLDGVAFIVMLHAPGVMSEGNITVGLIVDERASDAQVQAISDIATGAAGGPMAALAPLVGKLAGVERRPISFEIEGLKRSVRAGDLVEQSCEGMPSASVPGRTLDMDHTAHPVNSRLSLAKATRSVFNVFGMTWKDASGKRSALFAPFAWAG